MEGFADVRLLLLESRMTMIEKIAKAIQLSVLSADIRALITANKAEVDKATAATTPPAPPAA